MIISFAWTSAPLVAGRKTVTRREWSESYARRFHKGMVVDAYDRQPRFKGKKIAVIRLTHDPYLEHISEMPDADYEYEGFRYLDEHPDLIPKSFKMMPGETMGDRFDMWKMIGEMYWVIRFEIIRIEIGT